MTLIGAILKKVKSKDSFMMNKYGGDTSPPPELDEEVIKRRIGLKKRKHSKFQFSDVPARVDSSPPRLYPRHMFRNLEEYRRRVSQIYVENINLVMAIKRQHFLRGRVDCHWKHAPRRPTEQYEKRKSQLQHIAAANKQIYQLIITAKPRIETTKSLLKDWAHNRRQIIQMAEKPFLLFPTINHHILEDPAFIAPEGVTRPRVYITLRVKNGACLGSLAIELFPDVCPLTCRLFCELLAGDGLGYGYIGTCFFRKVPHLYWSGGDVIYDNGFGCYAQRGCRVPIAAENYHFPHSIPGLLSMRMTRNDEMCGIFNITFKALPQFDLKNVVFGRVIRPSSTYDVIQTLGNALGSQPVVLIEATRREAGARWEHGTGNTKLPRHANRLKAFL